MIQTKHAVSSKEIIACLTIRHLWNGIYTKIANIYAHKQCFLILTKNI